VILAFAVIYKSLWRGI